MDDRLEHIDNLILKNPLSLPPDDVRYYTIQKNLVRASAIGYAVVDELLLNPDGMCRDCLIEKLRNRGFTSGQFAKVIQVLRNKGLNIPKNVKKPCLVHNKTRSFDRLTKPYFAGISYTRNGWDAQTKKRILGAVYPYDAFMGQTDDPLEIDHRVPVQRLMFDGTAKSDIMIDDTVSDEQIKETYQLLSQRNNLIKDRACSACVHNGVKPTHISMMAIDESSGAGLPYVLGENDCSTCPFAYPEKFGLPVSIKLED